MGEERGPGYELCLRPHYAWVQRLFSLVPGARGYLGKEKLREVDVLIRRYCAERVDEAVRELEAARQSLAARASQAYFSTVPSLGGSPLLGSGADLAGFQAFQALSESLRSLSIELQNLGSDLLYADSGWAPIGAAQAVREEEIRQLCEYDDAVIGVAEAILKIARELRVAAEAGDVKGAQEKISELREAVSQARSLYEERRKYLRFVTHQGLTAREALEKIGGAARSALSKAKSFLARIFKK